LLKPSDAEEPLLKTRRSFASLREASENPATEQQGFAKFLAAKKADWRGDKKPNEEVAQLPRVQLGPGKEVPREGSTPWRRLILDSEGSGVGLIDDAVEVSPLSRASFLQLIVRYSISMLPISL
jgi:hypothetical protein